MRLFPTSLSVVLALLTLVSVQPALAADRSIDPRVEEILHSMEGFLGGVMTAEIVGDSSVDVRLEAGLLAEQSATGHMWVERPGRLRVSMGGDTGPRDIYIVDGQLSIYTAEKQYYARAAVPKDVDQAVTHAIEVLDMDTPFFDLVHRNPADNMLEDVHTGMYLGTSRIRGVECHHLVLRDSDNDIQLWIATGDRPVPRKIVITSKWEGGSPRYTTYLDWKISPKIDPGKFVFVPPEGSVEIKFMSVVD